MLINIGYILWLTMLYTQVKCNGGEVHLLARVTGSRNGTGAVTLV